MRTPRRLLGLALALLPGPVLAFTLGVLPIHSPRVLVERYEPLRAYLQRGLKLSTTGRSGLSAAQVLRSLVLQRVKNWDYRELRERIADGLSLRCAIASLLREKRQRRAA